MSNWIPIELVKDGAEDLRSSFVKNPKLYAEKVLCADAINASITMPIQTLSNDGNAVINNTVTIPFYIQDNFVVGNLSNDWGTLVPQDWGNSFTEMLNMISSFTGSSQVTAQSEAMSLKSWKGSKFDGFSVHCLFIATNRDINPTRIIKTLAAAALPTKLKGDNTAGTGAENFINFGTDLITKGSTWLSNQITENNVNFFGISSNTLANKVAETSNLVTEIVKDIGMVAPLHYGIDTSGDDGRPYKPAKGTTLTLQVGEYFRASELVVNSISGITFSKEIVAPKAFNHKRSGDLYNPITESSNHSFPLWGECTISLSPCSMMTKEKFEGYFLDKYADGTTRLENIIGNTLTDAAKGVFPNTISLPKI